MPVSILKHTFSVCKEQDFVHIFTSLPFINIINHILMFHSSLACFSLSILAAFHVSPLPPSFTSSFHLLPPLPLPHPFTSSPPLTILSPPPAPLPILSPPPPFLYHILSPPSLLLPSSSFSSSLSLIFSSSSFSSVSPSSFWIKQIPHIKQYFKKYCRHCRIDLKLLHNPFFTTNFFFNIIGQKI